MPIMLSDIFCDDELLWSLGRVAAESSYLEKRLEQIIGKLAKLTPLAQRVLVNRFMFSAKLDMLDHIGKSTLARRKKPKEKLSQLIKEIGNLNTERNNAIHGEWRFPIPEPDLSAGIDGILSRKRKPHATKRSTKHGKVIPAISYAEAISLADRIAQKHAELDEFVAKTWRTVPRRSGARTKSKTP